MLASVYAVVGHSYVAGKLLSWFALVLSVALCAWLANRVYGRTAAVIAALLCASSPGLRAYVGTLQYEVVTGALFALLLCLATRVREAQAKHQATQRAVVAGIAGAALVLTRETFVLVVPLTAWWVWMQLRHRIGHRGALLAVTALLGIAAIPAIIWSAAQTVHYQRLILIAEKGPEEFQLGNNPVANGAYNEPLVGMSEPAGLEYIRAYPGDALRLAIRKVLYLFGVLRDGWNVPHPASVWIWRATTGALPLGLIEPAVRGGWLLVSCLLAVYMLRGEGLRAWWVLPATVSAILLVHVITLGSYRFAVPLLPVLYVLASGPLAALVRAAGALLRTRLTAVACGFIIVLSVAAQYQRWPLQVEYDATDLDGIQAVNGIDEVSRSLVRIADARRGVRPVAMLPDTYLPRGWLTAAVRLRRSSAAPDEARPVARVMLVHNDGEPACVVDVSSVQLQVNDFTEVAIPCFLKRDGAATFTVFSLAEADLAIDIVRLTWRN